MDPEETRRRIKAARALAGYSMRDLAKAIDEPGMGERILRSIEGGENGRVPRRRELQAIAAACGLPFEFFTADFAALANGTSETGVDAVLNRLNEMDRSYREFIQDVRATVIGTAGQLQNEIDAARRAHVLPTQRLEEEAESRPARPAGRRRTR